MLSNLKKLFFNDKSEELKEKELVLKEKELELRNKELELKEKELNSKEKIEELTEVKTEVIIEEKKSNNKKEFTEEQKKAYALKMKEAKEKGKEYEEFIAEHFKINGYEVNLHGIAKGKKDKGIDIICTKDDELILIQCKNWKVNNKFKVGHEKLKAFVGSCTEYVNENKLFDKRIKLKFITSNYIVDESGKKFLDESKTLQYEVIEYKI